MRSILMSAGVAAVLAVPGAALAQNEPSSVKELDAVAQWLTAKSTAKCTEKCFVLSKLSLGGAVDKGTLTFRLEGTALASHAVAIPLFGTPTSVRVEDVSEVEGKGTKAAAVGFEGDHYFVVTRGGEGGRFVIEGKLFLEKESALVIPGPLNALETDFTSGRMVEGTKLSGLTQTTVHFDAGDAKATTEPPVFQLSRAIRVQRETSFEYRLVLRSGVDLGVVRLPLSLGEKVLDVTGVAGWKVEASDLVLPTAGKSATITVTGTLPDAQKTLVPDGRAPFEWWLVESDAEHRVTPKVEPGSAAQLDAAESPIPRTQPTARLFLAKKGQHLALSVQALAVVEALGAVVRDHHRTVVITANGDVVGDELFTYENSGLDHLPVLPVGMPVFQATDGVGERIMRRDPALAEILLPLRKGVHQGRIQTVGESRWGLLGGALSIDPSAMPLTASRTTVRVGLPTNVHPVVALGGDRAQWFVGFEGLVALAIAAFVSTFAFTRTRDRVLGALALGGLGFVSIGAFAAATGAVVLAVLATYFARVLEGTQRTRVLGGLVGAAALTTIVAVAASSSRTRNLEPAFWSDDRTVAAMKSEEPPSVQGQPISPAPMGAASSAYGVPPGLEAKEEDKKVGGKGEAGNFATNHYATGIVQGVQPVALPLPSAARWVVVERELVPRDRPLAVRIYYVTTAALAPALALWLGCFAALAFFHRDAFRKLVAALRARLAHKPTPPAAEPPTEPQPQ
ncbi:MAG: hypothetical protein IPJ34_21565 [Myxococcales bacterium]|nr:hypothetical protein [Myxococcales bacterium]